MYNDTPTVITLKISAWLGLVLSLLACQVSEPIINAAAIQQPNVLLVVVDDAGFTDFGAFGGEIETPNIDKLAKNAAVLTNFHVAPTCSPTRSMLLSGVDSHIAGLGNMYEELAPNQQGQPGYEGYLHERVAPLPALFQDAGYRTYMAGKWHLGLEADQSLSTDHLRSCKVGLVILPICSLCFMMWSVRWGGLSIVRTIQCWRHYPIISLTLVSSTLTS